MTASASDDQILDPYLILLHLTYTSIEANNPMLAADTSPQLKSDPLPNLPFEIVRRIIHHRLALYPSFPGPPIAGSSSRIEDEWETMPGQMGKKVALTRKREREDVMRAGLILMRVCKSWKPVVARYLYASPPITTSSLLPLTHAVHIGDTKWDDTRLHPHSVPGRYISTLDLSTLSDGYFGPHVTSLSKACAVLLPLLPNLRHLKLPGGTGWGIIPCQTILDSPFVGQLRALEGVQITDLEDGGDVCRLLRSMKKLEVLSILGPGSSIFTSPPSPSSTSVDLRYLHTITLDGVQRGPILSLLIHSDLPSLRRVLMTSYNETISDLTTSLLATHGHKLLSLTFLPTREWPAIHPTPPLNILSLCPNLDELVILIPNTALQKKMELARGLTGEWARGHPLRKMTLPKWLDRVSASPNASPVPTSTLNHSNSAGIGERRERPPSGNPLLATILTSPPPNLRQIRIDGFSWVSPKLGRAAQHAGAGGETRTWASYAERRGIELVDGEGKIMPSVAIEEEGLSSSGMGNGPVGERGRRRGSRGLGMVGMISKLEVGSARAVEEDDEDGG